MMKRVKMTTTNGCVHQLGCDLYPSTSVHGVIAARSRRRDAAAVLSQLLLHLDFGGASCSHLRVPK